MVPRAGIFAAFRIILISVQELYSDRRPATSNPERALAMIVPEYPRTGDSGCAWTKAAIAVPFDKRKCGMRVLRPGI